MVTGAVWEGGVSPGGSVDIKVGGVDIVSRMVMRGVGSGVWYGPGWLLGLGLRGVTIGDRLDHGDLRMLTIKSATLC